MKLNVLVIDDDPLIRNSLKLTLQDAGYFVKTVSSGAEGVALIRQNILPFSLVIVDYHMPEEKGSAIINQIQEINEKLPLMVFSGDKSDEVYDEVLTSGALTVLIKGSDESRIIPTAQRLIREYERWTKLYKPASNTSNNIMIQSVGMVGESDHLADVANLILKFAPLEQSVLIRGENGTGKEKVAIGIHENSKRSRSPYIAINCAAIPKDLVESELFGSEKGAYTGAIQRKGKFQAAQGGTIFLDEIGDMPAPSQATLLRVLQEKEVTPVGGTQPVKLNVRVVAATNADLEAKIKDGSFRQDLFYRLNALQINLIPLRDRPEDIPPLVQHFLSIINKENDTNKTILASTVKALQRMPWYGNVRELYGAIAQMHALSPSEVLRETFVQNDENKDGTENVEDIFDYDVFIYTKEQKEKEIILRALKNSSNLVQTAKILNIPRSTLRSRMKALNIENPFSEREEK
ncbi:MAG TPA: sigma-54 dependent transcriptional regulator [Bdellovibrio sp.]|uniref:sigma-54-dependent transcriptional regulator n=1 Tax=Bdellovibrio sp. TaxID=28201 RepID=UPI002F18CC9D